MQHGATTIALHSAPSIQLSLNELTGTATTWMDHIKAPEWLPAIRCTSRMLQWQNLRPTCANAVVPIDPIVVYCGLWKGICTMISWWYSLGMTLVATNLVSRYLATRWGSEYTWTVSNCLEQSFWESFSSRVETLYCMFFTIFLRAYWCVMTFPCLRVAHSLKLAVSATESHRVRSRPVLYHRNHSQSGSLLLHGTHQNIKPVTYIYYIYKLRTIFVT